MLPKTIFYSPTNQVMHDYGALLSNWNYFEIVLEAKISQLAGLAPKDAAIILGGLAFGNKPSILYSLMASRRKRKGIAEVKAVINQAKRNTLIHSFLSTTDTVLSDTETKPRFTFLRREVKESMKVTHHSYTPNQFSNHFEEFDDLLLDAMKALQIDGSDVAEYLDKAGLTRPTRKRRQGPRRGAKSRSK